MKREEKFNKHILTILIICLFFYVIFSCLRNREELTEPQQTNGKPDTTTHDFIWSIDTIGWRSSELFDVSIINENNVWVSGYIRKEGTDTVYGYAHWNGTEWKLERFRVDLPYLSYSDNSTGIHAISDENIWLASGSILNWDGHLAKFSYSRDIYSENSSQKYLKF